MPEYTITVCNYNMGETIDRALRSILDQVDDRFEVLVVDDGSTDESVAVVRSLQEEYEVLKLVELQHDPGRHLGLTRNVSVRQAEGDHVLLQLDADDVYDSVIVDFVTVYERFRERIDHDFLFVASDLIVGPRSFLLSKGPYRNLPVGAEDTDMWLRMLAEDALIWIETPKSATEISSPSSWLATIDSKLRRGAVVRIGEYQTGASPFYRLWWNHKKWRRGSRATLDYVSEYVLTPYAFLTALFRQSYEPSHPHFEPVSFERAIADVVVSLSRAEREYGVSIDRESLSDTGREWFGVT